MIEVYILKKNVKGVALEALKKLESVLASKNISFKEDTVDALLLNKHIFFGTWKFRLNINHLIKYAITIKESQFICLESPVIGRKGQYYDHREKYFRVGLNGAFADKGFDYAYKKTNRWEKIYKKKYPGVRLNGNFLPRTFGIVLQMPSDAAVGKVNMNVWQKDLIDAILKKSSANIIVRTPPLLKNFKYYEKIKNKRINYMIGSNTNLNEYFSKISAQFTFSSTMGVDAFLKNVPSFSFSEKSFLFHHQRVSFDEFLNGKYKFDKNLLNFLSNTTWSIDEFGSLEFKELILDKFIA